MRIYSERRSARAEIISVTRRRNRRPKPQARPKKSLPPARAALLRPLMAALYNPLRTVRRMLASTVLPGWHAVVSASVIFGLIAFVMGLCPRMTVLARGFLITLPRWLTPELRRDEPFSVVLSDGLNKSTSKYRAAHPNVAVGFQTISE